jgi:hypothetical protein
MRPTCLVHKDIRIYFDGNRYCAPPTLLGEHFILKADAHTVSLYQMQQRLVEPSWKISGCR